MKPWYAAGHVVRVSIPPEHVAGHEQADNPSGPRPWLIVNSRYTKTSGLFIAVPLTSSPPKSPLHRPLADGDIEPVGPSPITTGGTLLLEQVRAVSIERAEQQPCGRLKPGPLQGVQGELAALFESLRG